MTPRAFFIGSIGVLVETSDLQRRAFNAAFAEAGLDWNWSPDAYALMLRSSGGRDRIADFAAKRGETVDADALHDRKSEIFQARIAAHGLPLRPGIAECLEAARDAGLVCGFVTTTDRENVDEILAATRPQLDPATFDFIGDRSMVGAGKPDPAIYLRALDAVAVSADRAVALEDSPQSAEAARAAGIPVLAYPGAFHRDRDFGDIRVIDAPSPSVIGLEAARQGAA